MLLRLAAFVTATFALAQQPAVEAARLEGSTLSAAGQPLRKARLMLRPLDVKPGNQALPYATNSDAEGKFVFEAVEPGRYELYAERTGYLQQSYGAKHNREFPISLSAGQVMKDLTFHLIPQAVVSGRVLDDKGDAAGRTQIRVLRKDSGGEPFGSRNVMSDDLGDFKFASNSPGQYYICATPQTHWAENTRSAIAEKKKRTVPEQDFLVTCYPSATDEISAVAITVAAGQDISGVEIRLRKSTIVRVRGKVRGQVPDRPYNRMMVAAYPVGGSGAFQLGGSSQVDNSGNFEIVRLSPGPYRLVATSSDSGDDQTFGSVRIEVGNQDLTDVSLNLAQPAELKGRIRIEGQQLLIGQIASKMVVGMAIMSGYARGTPMATPADDGTFTVKNIAPEKYSVSLLNLPDGAYLSAVRLGDQEFPPNAIDLTAGVGDELQLILRMGAGRIDGTVRDEDGKNISGVIVTMLPDPFTPEGKYLYREAIADQNGAFRLQGLTPGKYRLYAWDNLEYGQQFDLEKLKANASRSVALELKENGRENADLRLAAR